jgi:hypothetical protein
MHHQMVTEQTRIQLPGKALVPGKKYKISFYEYCQAHREKTICRLRSFGKRLNMDHINRKHSTAVWGTVPKVNLTILPRYTSRLHTKIHLTFTQRYKLGHCELEVNSQYGTKKKKKKKKCRIIYTDPTF